MFGQKLPGNSRHVPIPQGCHIRGTSQALAGVPAWPEGDAICSPHNSGFPRQAAAGTPPSLLRAPLSGGPPRPRHRGADGRSPSQTHNWEIRAPPATRSARTSDAPSRRSARFGIHVRRIVAYVRLRLRMQRYSVQRLARHTRGSRPWPQAWAQFWAHSSMYGAVHRWSPGSCSRGSRTVADAGERWSTLLESVLGATPQEFESPILRHADLQEHLMMAAGMRASRVAWSHLVVSVLSAGRCHRRDMPSLLCLVTDAPDGPNREAHAARACALPFRAGRERPRPGCRLLLGAAGYPLTFRPHHTQ
jgi:hypothetical protein